MSNLACGVEGGGTKTRVVIINLDTSEVVANELYEVPTNPYLKKGEKDNFEETMVAIRGLIDQTIAKHHCEKPKYLGITASGFNNYDARIDKAFEDYTNFVQCQDTFGPLMAYEAQYGKKPAVIIAGTGSAGQCEHAVGGLGHFLNEQGCGFSAVKKLVERICLIKDGFKNDYGSYGNLWDQFCKFNGFPTTDYRDASLLALMYGKDKDKLAKFNYEMAHSKEAFAANIYREEFEYLAEMIEILSRVDAFSDVVCVGSFWFSLIHQHEAAEAFRRYLQAYDKTKHLGFLAAREITAAVGVAMQSAKREWRGEKLFDDFWQQIDKLRAAGEKQ